MKTTEQVQKREGDMHNKPGKTSMPKGDVNDTGVKNGIGIPDVAAHKQSASNANGNNNKRKVQFSNERPIF